MYLRHSAPYAREAAPRRKQPPPDVSVGLDRLQETFPFLQQGAVDARGVARDLLSETSVGNGYQSQQWRGSRSGLPGTHLQAEIDHAQNMYRMGRSHPINNYTDNFGPTPGNPMTMRPPRVGSVSGQDSNSNWLLMQLSVANYAPATGNDQTGTNQATFSVDETWAASAQAEAMDVIMTCENEQANDGRYHVDETWAASAQAEQIHTASTLENNRPVYGPAPMYMWGNEWSFDADEPEELFSDTTRNPAAAFSARVSMSSDSSSREDEEEDGDGSFSLHDLMDFGD